MKISLKFCTNLRDDVKIRNQCRLQNDGNVGCIEKFDWVTAVLTTITGRLDGKIDTEALEVYDYSKDENGSQKVHQVGQILPVESFA
jgi:hypothetical protein